MFCFAKLKPLAEIMFLDEFKAGKAPSNIDFKSFTFQSLSFRPVTTFPLKKRIGQKVFMELVIMVQCTKDMLKVITTWTKGRKT